MAQTNSETGDIPAEEGGIREVNDGKGEESPGGLKAQGRPFLLKTCQKRD